MKKQNIIEFGRKIIKIEQQTLGLLHDSLDTNFEAVINLISKSTGRVILTGIGKSALIGKKIVATLNSTGTPSIFMHAADAIHGDLGIVQKHDIVICISKSGETPEIKVLVPLVKRRGNQLIAIISNKASYLCKRADISLFVPVDKEADPNNLAPTSSTTAQLALGDAIAITLLQLKNFSSQDFAQFHPGGALGKQLFLRVADIYPNNESPFVFQNASIRDTIIEMTSKRLGTTVVLDKENKIIGIITDGDLRRMLENNFDTKSLVAEDIMSKNPKTIESNELAARAMEIIQTNNISQLIVVENNVYVGIVHLHDLIREGLI